MESGANAPLSCGIRRRPTLPGRVQPSTIGAEGLNFCVRDGNRWDPFAIVTGNCCVVGGLRSVCFTHHTCPRYRSVLWKSSSSLKLSLLPSGLLTLPGCILSDTSSLMRAALSHFATRVRCHTLTTAQFRKSLFVFFQPFRLSLEIKPSTY